MKVDLSYPGNLQVWPIDMLHKDDGNGGEDDGVMMELILDHVWL